jgi:hypothetical protein
VQPLTPSFLPLITLIIFIVALVISKLTPKFTYQDTVEDENLANYFNAIRPIQKKQALNTENYFTAVYGLSRFGFRKQKRLENSGVAPVNKQINGVATYRILDNPLYRIRLDYVEPPKFRSWE